ncbi:MAG: flagellar FlbD family protein [Myxococcota bacterium]|jgi:flagellar protein FlbD|nr:flagellar FlbD family protein [Myxococcota bacterium]
MINLTRLNDEKFVLNVAHITTIRANPDTIIDLTNGENIRVKEPPEKIVELATAYMQRIGGMIHLSSPDRIDEDKG